MIQLFRNLRTAFTMMLLMTLILGIIYPLLTLGIAHILAPHKANGSIVKKGHHIVGSTLIAQDFHKAKYFHPRPSAAGKGYDAMASSGSNLGPDSKKRFSLAKQRILSLKKENPLSANQPIPIDAITASGSGLDPDISPENAHYQAARVAEARHLPLLAVLALINRYTQHRQLAFLGEPRVNVLSLNMALDNLNGKVHNMIDKR